MSYKKEFLGKLKDLIVAARAEHDDLIKIIPIEPKETVVCKNSYKRYPAFDSVLKGLSDELKSQIKENEKSLRNVGYDLAFEFFTHFGDRIMVDTKGHNRRVVPTPISDPSLQNRYEFDYRVLASFFDFQFTEMFCNIPNNGGDFDIEEILRSVFNLVDWDTGGWYLMKDRSSCCRDCGDDIRYLLDLDTLVVGLLPTYVSHKYLKEGESPKRDPEPCKFSQGIMSFDIDFEIPSGRLVLANRLVSLLTEDEFRGRSDYVYDKLKGYSDGNSMAYLIHEAEYFNTHGIVYLSASNCYPQIFKNKVNGEVLIKDEMIYHRETDEETDNFTPDEELLGNICMDLWASTAMDYDKFVEYCNREGKKPEDELKELDATLVDVVPGSYRATNLFHSGTRDDDGLFARIVKID